jgi:hypothetical protein
MKRSTLAWCGLLAAVGTLAVPLVPEVLAQMAPPTESKGIAAKVTLDALARMLLACERAAITAPLNGSDAAQCSVVYEEFKLRAFGGDFEKLNVWWRSQQVARQTTR